MIYSKALRSAVALYGELWFEKCSILMTRQGRFRHVFAVKAIAAKE